ncbi:hypothetical protein BDV97DRAFT_361981 [Delphinella strobiligena]|nr:hypothetical protein BDV97DRAFT_361981 [Delphinella strobiligena]
MADYNVLKVTELKDELKKRSIPVTGLTRKQQIIDRLIEDDNEKHSDSDPQNDASTEQKEESIEPQPASEEKEQHTEEDPDRAQFNGAAEPQSENAPEETTCEEAAAPSESAVVTPAPAQPEDPSDQTSDTAVAPTNDEAEMKTVEQDAAEHPTSDDAADGTLDSRKRKRRSATPPVRETSVNKKLKQAGEESDDSVVHLQREGDAAPASGTVIDTPSETVQIGTPDAPLHKPDATTQPMATGDDVMDVEPTTDLTNEAAPTRDPEAQPSKANRSPNQRRFKDIMNPSGPAVPDMQATSDDGVEVSPALYPATRALYVRDLVRPINVTALKDHLEQLATPPGQSITGEHVEECYVDTLKTHAFALFTSISAASRVRASLHARVWPAETQRKALWVDFIPEENMSPWIDQERAGGASRASSAKRWEISYHVLDDKVDVTLVEAGLSAQSRSSFAQGMPGAPIGPRGDVPAARTASHGERRRPSEQAPPARPTAKVVEETNASFLELDKLFQFTTAKPKLYWQPVSEELADRRLDELDRETSRDWSSREDAKINGDALGRGLDQLKRYTFEDGDVLVDGGPEYGGGAAFGRGGESYRGGGGGGGRRRGADRYR